MLHRYWNLDYPISPLKHSRYVHYIPSTTRAQSDKYTHEEILPPPNWLTTMKSDQEKPAYYNTVTYITVKHIRLCSKIKVIPFHLSW